MRNFCLAEILSMMTAMPAINAVTTMAIGGSMANDGFPRSWPMAWLKAHSTAATVPTGYTATTPSANSPFPRGVSHHVSEELGNSF
jgi:hypothetical protein